MELRAPTTTIQLCVWVQMGKLGHHVRNLENALTENVDTTTIRVTLVDANSMNHRKRAFYYFHQLLR